MEYKWLQKDNNDKLIVFFNGWGMDENTVAQLDCEDYDVVVLYDYNDLNTDITIEEYKEKRIIAWSMGVSVAGIDNPVIKNIVKNCLSATAVAGTPLIVDDKFGIPEKIYNMTFKSFNKETSLKFFERMFSQMPENFPLPRRSVESQKSELEKMIIYNSKSDFRYTKVIIPEKDFIVPTRNQKRYWEQEYQNGVKIETIDSGHYPFLLYNKFSELI